MSAFERSYKRKLKQQAVFWPAPVSDGYGKMSFSNPCEIKVRWDDSRELFIDAEGNEKTSSAIIFAADDLELLGYIWLGEFDDLSAEEKADPHLLDTARQILGYERVPTMKADFFVRKAFL